MRPHLVAGILAALIPIGCTGSSAPALTPVSGEIKLNGKALAGVRVKFVPQGSTGGHGGGGVTDENGKYEIVANRANNRKGLLPGDYKVVLSRLVQPDGTLLPPDVPPIESAAKESVPENYSKLESTPLIVNIGTEAKTVDVPLKK